MRTVRGKNKKIVTLIILILVLAAGTGVYAYTRGGAGNEHNSGEAQTTSDAPTAQPGFSDGDDREPGNSLNENKGSGGITDSNGADSSDTSKPITSQSGEITVYLPHKGSVVEPGQEVSGTSTLSSVSYRLIDDLTGQIAKGELKVVDGKFSGELQFDTGAREGRLDIFGTKPDFSEFSNIEIPIKFQ